MLVNINSLPGFFRARLCFLQNALERLLQDYRLVPSRTRGNDGRLYTRQFADLLNIVPRLFRQAIIPFDANRGLFPSRHGDILRRASLQDGELRRHLVVDLPLILIPDADLDLVERVHDIQLRDDDARQAVHPRGVPYDQGVYPSTPPGPAGRGPELLAAVPEVFPHVVVLLRGKWSAPHACGVRLHDAHDLGDPVRADAEPGAGAAGGGIG